MGVLQLDSTQKGLRFDGVNDYVSVPNIATFTTNYTSSLSIVMQVNIANIIANRFLFITPNQGGDTTGVYFYLNTTRLEFVLFNNGSRGTSWEIPFNFVNNVDYHISVSYNNGNCNMYVNGVLYSNIVNDSRFGGYLINDNTTSNTFYSVMARAIPIAVAQYTNGICRDLKLYNRAITGSEVTQLFNGGNVTSDCLVDYRFNNRQGTLLADYAGSNVGTLTNYTTPETTIGSSNKWLNESDGTPYAGGKNILLINNN